MQILRDSYFIVTSLPIRGESSRLLRSRRKIAPLANPASYEYECDEFSLDAVSSRITHESRITKVKQRDGKQMQNPIFTQSYMILICQQLFTGRIPVSHFTAAKIRPNIANREGCICRSCFQLINRNYIASYCFVIVVYNVVLYCSIV